MATQKKRPKRETGTTKPEEENTKAALEKAKTEAEAALAQAKDEEQARQQAEAALTEAKKALTNTQQEVNQERQARNKAEQALADAREELNAAQAKIKHEYQARVKAEKAMEEAKSLAQAKSTNTEQPPAASSPDNREQQVSFIVRVTVDEQGEPRRTKIEHAQSAKGKSLSSLDVQELAAFIKAHLGPSAVPKPTISGASSPATDETVPSESVEPTASLAIASVEVFRMGYPGEMALFFNSNESIVVQAGFKLEGPEALSLAAQELDYEIRIHAHDVTRGTTTSLTTQEEKLIKDILEYPVRVQALGLSPGLYRLVTRISLQAPAKLVGHHEGPVFQVGEVQPAGEMTIPEEVAQPQ